MADYKRIIKNVLFIALVPSVVVAGYYGVKAYQKFKNKDKEDLGGENKDNELSGNNKEAKSSLSGNNKWVEKEAKIEVISKPDVIGEISEREETKVIPISRNNEIKDLKLTEIKEAQNG